MGLALRTGNLRALAGDAKLIPIIRGELMNRGFQSFDLRVDAWSSRPHDGWWHPSSHSSWPARKLALYLMHPERIEEELMGMESMLTVTQGHFWHTFIQRVLLRNGILECDEVPLEDPEHRRRGHMDGKMSGEGLEIKTINNDWLAQSITSEEQLREKKPGYYAQGQDYLDMANLDSMRFLFMGTYRPFPMVEFVMHRDEPYQRAQRAKYTEALEHVDAGTLPLNCCEPRSKTAKGCEARGACPIGRII
jgi:hypothetical protein